ncbi:MAG: heptose kinase, partial [Candidatus Accumulibacter sp.]|nr:heptose kinase [Accumulibacter sp.]
MNFWWFDPEAYSGVAKRVFASLARVFALTGECITSAPLSEVLRVECEGRRYYVKRYAGNGKNALRCWFGLR